MSEHKNSIKRAKRRAFRVRERIKRQTDLPRISVFRSLKQIYAQLIDDNRGVTIASASSVSLKLSGNKSVIAREVGKQLAQRAKELDINAVVFDRGSYMYHGRVQELAEGLREGGLQL
ncbi:MAG TPA: 50S ribosomal protein L18 [Candidatus Babeliales bacterium]|nr:50S ribosomal protein L18 [Candidatus Babeliales bacterium]